MSTRHLPRAIASRGKTALEIERENFEKSQNVAINKAINTIECPVKEKHVRTTVLGTFKDHGAGLYWTIAGKLPLQGNPIVAWKFLHVLHKILRDGHQHSIPDSYKNHTILIELGKLWTHLKEGYGKLIACYCKLIVEKLNFHRKNKEIPGNLNLSDDQFAKICGSDVNNYFEISVEMLDYMDEILSLQQAVFGSLDMSRSNSMTNSGQCRLAPLILCIQDSCQLYDYIVKSLFRLHSSLPPDTLSGHRDRFLSMYKRLKQFYFSSSNLQYFKNLVQVPSLPDEPPNFLIASDFSKHVKPVAVVPEEPEPDPEPEIEDLIDTSEPTPPVNNFGNGFGPPEIDERDLLIERLTKEIQYLRSEIERLKLEDQKIIAAQKEEIVRLEKILSELRLSADRALKDNDELKKKLEKASVHVGAAVKLTEAEKQAKSYEDKFKKMKDIYQKLREEHVALLRTNAEVTKKLDAEKRTVAEKEQLLKESKSEMDRIEQERKVIQESLKQSADETSSQLAMTMAKNTDLQTEKEHLENQLKMLEDTKSSLMVQLETAEEECTNLQARLEELEEEKRTQESSLSGEISSLQEQLTALRVEKESLDSKLNQEIHELKSKLEQEITDKNSLEDQLRQQIKVLESRLSESQTDKQNTEKKLTDDMDLLQKTLLGSLYKTIQEGKAIIQDSLDQFENPTHIAVKCTAEFLLLRTEPVLSSLENLKETKGKYLKDKTELDNLICCITRFSHQLGDSVMHGIATTHSANLEAGEELGNACRDAGESGLKVLNALEKGAIIDGDVDHTVTCIKKMIALAENLVPKMVDVKEKEIGDMLDNEMSSTTSAIEKAARRIAEMLEKTRDETTGIELKVNESILDSCTGLMQAIRILIERSRDLQREIVVQGRGTSTEKDFYKKNHRWTEGLLSAAKAVGWGATALMEAADKVVKGEGKFEELIVCSNEIAASTAQLVVASKVKADRRSKKLSLLSEASKGVTQNTGKVVGSAREGSQIIEEQGLMDFSKLSLMQSKKFEMQSQVRVLELEKELETERYKLGELRKKHYQLAGASEGWEEDQIKK